MPEPPPANPSPRPAFDSPPIREFNDRTTLWLLEDPLNLRDLLGMRDRELAASLDFAQAERVNRSFIPADLQKEESDLIFRVPFLFASKKGKPPPAVWIYFLLEHQSRPDAAMTLRLLSYMLELWELQRREWDDRNAPIAERRLTPVLPFVFYTGRRNWKTPLEFRSMFDVPPGFERFIPQWETLFLNLRKTSPETLTEFGAAIGGALRVMLAENAPYETVEQILRDAMRGMESIPEEQFGRWLRIGNYILRVLQHLFGEAKGSPLYNVLMEEARQSKFADREETQEMYTMANRLMDEGMAKGIVKGRAEGRAEAQASLRATLEQILATKFGPLPATVLPTIAAADLDTLNGWALAAAVARTLAEVGIESAEAL